MSELKFFVLRERATGRLMPKARMSMTHMEFGDNGPPRLFTTKGAASNALACWRMGHWVMGGDEDSVYAEPSMRSSNIECAARRKATDVDVVRVQLVELP